MNPPRTGHIPALDLPPVRRRVRLEEATVHRLSIRMTLPLLLAALALAGCGKQPGEISRSVTAPGPSGGGAGAEEAAVASTMSEAPEMVEDGLMESPMASDLGSGLVAGDAASALIRPVRFWRNIERVERNFEIAFADTDSTGRPTTAHVVVHKRLLGSFNILAGDPPSDPVVTGEDPRFPPRDTTLRLVRKRLDDHWVRRVLLKRVPPPPPPSGDGLAHDGAHARWRIAATSGVKVTSRDAETRIESLRIQSGPLDTTVTDPLALFRLRRLLHFIADEPVLLTVTTLRNDDVVLFHRGDGRHRFVNNGDKTYSARFRPGLWRGVQHLGVNALSKGTLFDDALPYDSQAWILPFVVAPTLLAEFVP